MVPFLRAGFHGGTGNRGAITLGASVLGVRSELRKWSGWHKQASLNSELCQVPPLGL